MNHPTELCNHLGVRASEKDARQRGGYDTKRIFTDYVRSLTPGEEPDAEMFETVWSTLRGALCAEMKKRSLWRLPPHRLGIYGQTSWSQEGAFDELAIDCYTFIFLDRLPALKAQLEVKDNIEGMVFRNIRNFLYDAQKKNDPLGFRTYRVLRGAVSRLIAAGTLHVVEGGPRPGGATVLAFAPGRRAEVARGADLEAAAREWGDELTLAIVTARGKRRRATVAALAARLAELPARGVEAFRFKDLADALKRAVRARWRTLGESLEGETAFESAAGESATRVRVSAPDTAFEDRQSYAELCARVERNLERADRSRRARGDLRRLWSLLRRQVAEADDDAPPSRREMARALGISRYRLARHFAVLGRWIQQLQPAG